MLSDDLGRVLAIYAELGVHDLAGLEVFLDLDNLSLDGPLLDHYDFLFSP